GRRGGEPACRLRGRPRRADRTGAGHSRAGAGRPVGRDRRGGAGGRRSARETHLGPGGPGVGRRPRPRTDRGLPGRRTRPTDRRVGDGDAPVTARPATLADSSLLLRWRNDPETRAVSRSTDRVSWEGHTGWYARAVEDPERELYVIERGGAPVGTVRFDALEGPEWEVSITLAPEARGHGLSRPVLAAGESVHGARHPGAVVIAAILPGN